MVVKTGPTAWITQCAASRPAVVATAWPVGRPSRKSLARNALQAARISGPPLRWMAPSTPPPPSSDELAALTIASADTVVMSPSSSSIRVTPPILARRVIISGDTPESC